MTQNTLINRVKKLHDFSVRGVLKGLDRPIGQRPQQRLKTLSEWFNSLDREDQARVEQVVQLAVHHGIFDVLALLDGARIKGCPDRGTLELFCRCGRKRQLLAGPTQKKMLNTIYHRRIYDQVFGSEV